jgi:branched-chain amino acid transport system substrate-binding protein
LVLDYKSALAKYFPGDAPDYVSLEGDFPSEVQYGIENRPHFADRITQGDGITSAQSIARAPGNYATPQHPDHDTHEWPHALTSN